MITQYPTEMHIRVFEIVFVSHAYATKSADALFTSGALTFSAESYHENEHHSSQTVIQQHLDTGAAATKPPPPVIFLQAAVSHIYATKSQPSVIFESDSVSHIISDWRRLSFYNVIMY